MVPQARVESSYQKLENEDTLSTISFKPLSPEMRKRRRIPLPIVFLAIFLSVFSVTSLLFCHLQARYNLFGSHHERRSHWSAFLCGDYEVPEFREKDFGIRYHNRHTEYSDMIGEELHTALVGHRWPEAYRDSATLRKVAVAYKACTNGHNAHDMEEMVASVTKHILPEGEMSDAGVAEAVAMLFGTFGVETFFSLEVNANFREPDGREPALVYVRPNAAALALKANDWHVLKQLGLRGRTRPTAQSDFALRLAQLPHTQAGTNSTLWQVRSVSRNENADFRFDQFFRTLFRDQNAIDVNKLHFVVTNPAFVRELGQLLRSTDVQVVRTFLTNALRRSIAADESDCVQAVQRYTPHVASVLYLQKVPEMHVRQEETNALFDLMADELSNMVNPYLSSDEQRQLLAKRLVKVGLTTEPPVWTQLVDRAERFEELHAALRIPETASSIVALLRLRRFRFQTQVAMLGMKEEAMRNCRFAHTPASALRIEYSAVGHWINVPAAALMTYERNQMVLDLATALAESVLSEGFRWSPYGSQRVPANACLVPAHLQAQERCFAVHGVPEEAWPKVAGVELAYRVLLAGDDRPYATTNVATDLASIAARDAVSSRIVVSFLQHHNINSCNRDTECPLVMPCYLDAQV